MQLPSLSQVTCKCIASLQLLWLCQCATVYWTFSASNDVFGHVWCTERCRLGFQSMVISRLLHFVAKLSIHNRLCYSGQVLSGLQTHDLEGVGQGGLDSRRAGGCMITALFHHNLQQIFDHNLHHTSTNVQFSHLYKHCFLESRFMSSKINASRQINDFLRASCTFIDKVWESYARMSHYLWFVQSNGLQELLKRRKRVAHRMRSVQYVRHQSSVKWTEPSKLQSHVSSVQWCAEAKPTVAHASGKIAHGGWIAGSGKIVTSNKILE